MRLKRLELQGFKSFVDRTILPFEPGITGVVGPNGCGKSNIVDAIQWVMGEQSAKHLRGDSMSDVIFNGSENRPATSMAEVSLVMDSTGVNLPPHLIPIAKGDEMAITRRLFRDGTAEYLINKTAVRLKDVHEVFMDTGVGRRAYSIIEQGQIDRMINVKPDDRRGIFEEVAGITKYKTKRREAERKLEQTRLNIERVDDIIRELDKQIRSLKIQATRARKYKEIKGELEIVDLFLLGRKLFSLQETLSNLESQKLKLREARSALDTDFSRYEAESSELDVKRVDQEKVSQTVEVQEREFTLKVQKLENQLALFQQEQQHIEQADAVRKQEHEELAAKLVDSERETEGIRAEISSLEENLSASKSEINSRQEQLNGTQTQLIEGERERSKTQNELNQATERNIYLENQLEHGQQKEREFNERSEALNERLTQSVSALEASNRSLAEAEERVKECQERGQRVEKEVSELYQECQQISSNLSEVEDELFQTREKFHGIRSRLESLTELQENLEGYSPTAKEVLLKMEVEGALPLAEAIQPDPEVEELVEVLLGESSNTILVQNAETARSVVDKIRESNLERVGILALAEIPQANNISCPAGAEPLMDRIRVKEGFEAVAQKWLGNIFLVDTDDVVFELRAQFPEATFVNKDALLAAHANRTFTCGTTPTRQGIFARRRQIEELEKQLSVVEADVHSLSTRREILLAELETQERRHSEMKDKLSSLHVEAVGYRKEREKFQLDKERSEKEYTLLTEESQSNSEQLDAIRAKLEGWQADQTEVLQRREDRRVALESLTAQLEQAKESAAEIQSSLKAKQIEFSKMEERFAALEDKAVGLESQNNQLRVRIENIEKKSQQDAERLGAIEAESVRVRVDRDESSERRNQLIAQLSEVREAHAQTCQLLNEIRLKREAIQGERNAAGEKIQEIEIRLAHEESSFEHQKNISLERYNREAVPRDEAAQLNLEEVPLLQQQVKDEWLSLPTEEKDALLEEHVENLRKKVGRYGEVNLTAINEFEEVQKRHDFLNTQKLDLENSIKILEQAIKRIDETTERRFRETFEGVNEKFQEVFPILFNGGKAKLALTNPDDILESGVDIMAQPPGKRLQSISLLSGGEKALTAVSLVLAIFARKPSPFCLLDEVDAPLDEANVSRFNTVIKRMASKSQFILVTHNRKTMDIVDALFGVTMEQAGISKMTSVRLN